jgi:Serine/Threonine/Tyrosine Kinase found in polyvalent proteins
MFNNEVRRKLENIIQGAVIKEQSDTCTTIRNKLCSSFSTSTTVKKDFESKSIIKEEQERFLKELATQEDFWVPELPSPEYYLAKGGEARVYLHTDRKSVIKINDGVYYATWLEYFNSLVIHNLLFPATAYTVLGFSMIDKLLHTVLKQPFISSDATADLDAIKELLTYNGFQNTRRQDYFNKEYGLILEDMHDENVILKDSTLFFIDTVFYLVKPETEDTAR